MSAAAALFRVCVLARAFFLAESLHDPAREADRSTSLSKTREAPKGSTQADTGNAHTALAAKSIGQEINGQGSTSVIADDAVAIATVPIPIAAPPLPSAPSENLTPAAARATSNLVIPGSNGASGTTSMARGSVAPKVRTDPDGVVKTSDAATSARNENDNINTRRQRSRPDDRDHRALEKSETQPPVKVTASLQSAGGPAPSPSQNKAQHEKRSDQDGSHPPRPASGTRTHPPAEGQIRTSRDSGEGATVSHIRQKQNPAVAALPNNKQQNRAGAKDINHSSSYHPTKPPTQPQVDLHQLESEVMDPEVEEARHLTTAAPFRASSAGTKESPQTDAPTTTNPWTKITTSSNNYTSASSYLVEEIVQQSYTMEDQLNAIAFSPHNFVLKGILRFCTAVLLVFFLLACLSCTISQCGPCFKRNKSAGHKMLKEFFKTRADLEREARQAKARRRASALRAWDRLLPGVIVNRDHPAEDEDQVFVASLPAGEQSALIQDLNLSLDV
ncbi:unnamed protein product [Amoebophrya sp. A120]|nr:unnamed protein product [Amoebophrya sp. A120]|eukprot:GSA120T00003983001.1